jgi:CRP-like cAMP-binding protein
MDASIKKNIRTFPSESIIIQEGQPNDGTLFILNEGRIGVFKQNLLIAEIRESGVFFGEMSALLETPRTATIKALTDCKVTVLTCDFDTLCTKFPSIAKKLMISLANRLKDITARHEKALESIQKMEAEISKNVYSMEHEMEEFLKELSKAEVEKAKTKAQQTAPPT